LEYSELEALLAFAGGHFSLDGFPFYGEDKRLVLCLFRKLCRLGLTESDEEHARFVVPILNPA